MGAQLALVNCYCVSKGCSWFKFPFSQLLNHILKKNDSFIIDIA